jgi:protein TonB
MDRQLFSPTSRVSSSRTRIGAVPVSMALHGVAICAALVLSSLNRVNSAPPPRRPPLTTVRVDSRSGGAAAQPPKGDGRPPAPAPVRVPARHAVAPSHVAPIPVPISTTDSLPTAETFTPTIADGAPPVVDTLPGSSPGTGGCPDCIGDDPGGDPRGPRSASAGDGSGGPIRISEIIGPRRIRYVVPTYPDLARRIRAEGDVALDCTIGPDGVVRDVRILTGNPLFHEAARAAVLRWAYTPTRLNGQAISVLLTVTVRFRLQS